MLCASQCCSGKKHVVICNIFNNAWEIYCRKFIIHTLFSHTYLEMEWFSLPWELLKCHVPFLTLARSTASHSHGTWAWWITHSLQTWCFPPFFLDTWIEVRDFQNSSHTLVFSADQFFRLNPQKQLSASSSCVSEGSWVFRESWNLLSWKGPRGC